MFALLLFEIETDPDWQTVDVDPDVDQSVFGSTTMVRTLLFKVCASSSRICVWIVPYRSKPRREPESL
jgi:hypothetical protein